MVVHSYIIVKVGGVSQSFPNAVEPTHQSPFAVCSNGDRRGGVRDGLWTTALLSHQSAAWKQRCQLGLVDESWLLLLDGLQPPRWLLSFISTRSKTISRAADRSWIVGMPMIVGQQPIMVGHHFVSILDEYFNTT